MHSEIAQQQHVSPCTAAYRQRIYVNAARALNDTANWRHAQSEHSAADWVQRSVTLTLAVQPAGVHHLAATATYCSSSIARIAASSTICRMRLKYPVTGKQQQSVNRTRMWRCCWRPSAKPFQSNMVCISIIWGSRQQSANFSNILHIVLKFMISLSSPYLTEVSSGVTRSCYSTSGITCCWRTCLPVWWSVSSCQDINGRLEQSSPARGQLAVVRVPLDAMEHSSCTSTYSDRAFPHLKFHKKCSGAHNHLLGSPKLTSSFISDFPL